MFTSGYVLGLKPNDLLDITYSQYMACKRGYERKEQDQEALAAKTGYYNAYFNGTRHASLKFVLQKIYATKHVQKHVDTIDVDAFLKQDKAFKMRYQAWQQTQKPKP